ncbi:MAG: alanine racemase [Candidatus Berkelbacteria bacterium]
MTSEKYRCYVEVDKKALRNNYQIFRDIVDSKCLLMSVVKSNAYGHGILQYAEAMVELGADYLGVDSVSEATALRKQGITLPILILGYTLPARIAEVCENNCEMTVSSVEQLEIIRETALSQKIRIHLKIDTGMHRQGFQGDEIDELISLIKLMADKTEIVGVYTHFGSAKNPPHTTETDRQIEVFDRICTKIQAAGLRFIKHAAATAGVINFKSSHYDMVRVGIGLMGLWPSEETKVAWQDKIELKPALSWKAIISEIKSVKAHECVGYDFTHKLCRDSTLAIIPVGYWHGLRRDLSDVGQVGIRGKKAPLVGRVSMDMIVVDVTNIAGVSIGDEVTLLGGSGELSAYTMAKTLQGSWYEVITQINPLTDRRYKD